MKREKYSTEINADASTVYNAMIGRETYKEWTAPFNPTSDFEGSWETGGKIYFVGISKEGRKEGMVAQIQQNDPGEYVAIKHLGMLEDDKEILDGPTVEGWAGAMEIYSFTENNGKTTVNVEVDVNDEYMSYFAETWPKALAKLKEISEKP